MNSSSRENFLKPIIIIQKKKIIILSSTHHVDSLQSQYFVSKRKITKIIDHKTKIQFCSWMWLTCYYSFSIAKILNSIYRSF